MTAAEPNEPGRDADIRDIQADIERTRGELGQTVEALSANLDAKKDGIVWWRRRSGRRHG
jgi:hypothetical protein